MGDKYTSNSSENLTVEGSPGLSNIDGLATQTIDLDQLLTRDVTASGSFDIKGEIWKSTFGKLLQALPIPAFLIDDSLTIKVMNQGTARISPEYEKSFGNSFQMLCADRDTAKRVSTVLRGVFTSRIPQITEAMLQIGASRIVGRLTCRSIRIMHERFLLVMVEDLTAEKNQLGLLKKHEQELVEAYGKVEQLVKERTDALMRANEALKLLIEGIESKRKDDRRSLCTGLQLSTEPLLALLKSEPHSERVRLLLDSLELAIKSFFEGEFSSWREIAIKLTPREIQVCELIRAGLTSKQVGEVLGITSEAVQSHRGTIRKKIGLDQSQGSLAEWLQRYRSKENGYGS